MNGTIKEFTKKEFDAFVAKNGYETFTADQVLRFNQEIINNQDSMDEFSKSCAAADFVSLDRAIVVDDNLVKSVVYYRECQIEPLEKGEFGSIMKSKQIVFADTALNRFKGIVGLPVDNDVIEKARKAEPIGTEKTYGGKLYIKTEKGWRPKPKGTGKGLKTDKEAQEKKFIENLVDAAKKYGKDSVQFQSAMLAPKNAYKNDNDMNRFLVKLSSELSQVKSKAKEEPGSEVYSTSKKETLGEAPEGVTQESYDSITKNARATQRGYTLNIDGKDVRVERTIDTSGGQRTPVYQIQGMEKKYWDLDKMIQTYRKEKQKDFTQDKKEAPLLRQVTAAQYKDRKDEILGEISKERLNLMNKYGGNWQDDASSKDLERLSSLVSRVNKLGENFNQFGDKSKNSSEHQMTEAQMRAYATARDPKAKEIVKLEEKK